MHLRHAGNPAAGWPSRQPPRAGAQRRFRHPSIPREPRWRRLAGPLVLLLLASLASAVVSAQSARDLFAAAQSHEREARSAMVSSKTSASVLRTVRAAVAAYEKVAAGDPSGSYADAALWSAAELAGDAFGAFGVERDRQTALRLARAILHRHRDSIYAPKAAEHLARLTALRFGAPVWLAGLQQRVAPGETTITVDLARAVWYRAVRLDDPPRLYLDLYNTRVPDALRGAVVDYETGAVTRLRLGHHPHDTTRIVLEGDAVHACAMELASGPARLILSCRTPSAAPPLPPPEWPSPRPLPALIPAAWLPPPPPLPARQRVEPDDLASLSLKPASPVVNPDRGPAITSHEAPGRPFSPAAGRVEGQPLNLGDGGPLNSAPAHPAGSPPVAASTPDSPMTAASESAQPQNGEPAGAPPDTHASALASTWPAPSSPMDAAPDADEAGRYRVPRPPLPSRPIHAFTTLVPAMQTPRLMPPPNGRPAPSLPPPPLLFADPVVPAMPATRPTVQISAATQVLTGNDTRIGGLERIQPDLGVRIAVPWSDVRRLYADVNVTQRGERPVVGRGLLRLSGFRTAGLTWSFDAGDTMAAPVTPDFGFSNLFAPPLNLRGVYVAGRSTQTSITASAARVMARRNIFGTDTLPTGQELIQVAFSHRPNRLLEIFGRASDVRGNNPAAYRALVDASREAGGGLRYRLASNWEVVADVGYSAFRRTGSDRTEEEVSALLGATWTGANGGLQLNASRRALGHFAVGSYPYNDRSSLFASGEWQPLERVRLYGGVDFARTGLDRDAAAGAAVSLPSGTSARAFGGTRLQFGSWSTVGFRLEGGGRDVQPSQFGGGFATDSGAVSVDWNLRVGPANALMRYERRSDVDAGVEGSGFTQHDGSAQLYVSLGSSQIFVQGLLSQQTGLDGSGQTLWQASGGSQIPLGRVYARVEGAWGHTRDWVTQRVIRRQSLSASATGRIASGTQFSFDVYADHTPLELPATSPWALRTMIRVTQSLSFGAARSARSSGTAPYHGPTGRVTGVIFADWNGNGRVDLDEEPVPGVRVVAGPAWVVGGSGGRFVLEGVPTGEQTVAVDVATVPASFDLPDTAGTAILVASRKTVTIDFPLVPVGSIHGVVFQDVDGNGELTAPDAAIDGAVLVLDDGVRTEVTREGRFWFDSVRVGSHSVSLLLPSLPDGAQLAGPATMAVTLSRDEPASQIAFVVTMEKRQEIRKIFTPKKRD